MTGKQARRRGLAWLAPAVALGLLVAACGTTTGAGGGGEAVKEVHLGGTYPMTGPLGTDGQEMVNAIQIAIDDVNAAGGIASLGGAKVKFTALDSKGAPEQAANNTKALIDQGVVGLIGAWLSSNTLATTQVAERAQIPHIVDQSQAKEILGRGFKYTYRVMFSPEKVGVAATEQLEELRKRLPKLGRSVVYLHEESSFGSALAEEWVKNAKNYDLEVKAVIAYPTATTNLSTEVARAIATEADMIMSSGYAPDSLLLLKALKEQGAKFKAVVGVDSAAWYTNRFAKQAGDLLNNVFDTSYPVNRGASEYTSFENAYRKRFNADPSDAAALSYTSARVLVEAIEKAGATGGPEIQKQLATGTFKPYLLAQDQITFSEEGQNKEIMPLMYQWQDGVRQTILPEKFATAKPRDPSR
ncbi:amino acid ABC transporter substrate-binding protein [Streptosporangium violaceochromogenes]|nr:amino acid ABC transporter substrate-binding protein [Streptosporangium violaceochromogenes]